MSRLPTLPCLLLLVLATPALAGPAVHFGFEGGLNTGQVTYHSDFFDFDPGYHPAWSLGLVLDAPLGGRLSLACGARYIEYGEKMGIRITDSSGATYASADIHNVFQYASVPLQVRYRPLLRHGLFLTGGPEVGYLIDVRQEFSSSPSFSTTISGIHKAIARPGGDIFEGVTPTSGYVDLFERWNFAVSGGAGWELPLAGHRAIAQVRYTQGLIDIMKSDEVKRTTRGIETLLGISW